MIEYSYHNERMSNFIVEKYENCVRNGYFPTNNRALHHVVVSYQIIHREHVWKFYEQHVHEFQISEEEI